jgi:hypothetical protein
MALFEDNTHVFIIRIWFERREIEGATEEWRALIEHMPSGHRRYLKDLDAILNFMALYLLEKRNADLGRADKCSHA